VKITNIEQGMMNDEGKTRRLAYESGRNVAARRWMSPLHFEILHSLFDIHDSLDPTVPGRQEVVV
jgi:hypothetical protein